MQRLSRGEYSGADLAPLTNAKRIIARHFPPVIADLYADPQLSGDHVEWISSREGLPVRFNELDKTAQQKLLDRVHQHQLAIRHLADELERKGEFSDAETVRNSVGSPDTDNLFSVGNEPVMTHWRIQPLPTTKATPAFETPAPARPSPPPEALATKVVPPAPERADAEPKPAVVKPPPETRRMPWWLLLLPLLLLLALLYWFWWLPRQAMLGPGGMACIPKPTISETSDFVVVFDTSGSMKINVNATPEDEEWLMKVTNDNSFRRVFMDPEEKKAEDARKEALLKEPTRMTVSKKALTEIIQKVPDQVPVGLVTYTQCNRPQQTHGFFNAGQRTALTQAIQNLSPEGATPLAASLKAAASMVDGVNKDAQIVIFVDGTDGCKMDQCLVAQQLKQEKPRLRFHVLDLTGSQLSNCIAENTGGRVYNPKNSKQITTMLTQAMGEVTGEAYCK